MQKFGVELALKEVKRAREEWTKAQREFQRGQDSVLARLMHEAARNFMSVGEIAKFSGLSPKRVRTVMRLHGLNPSQGKRLLSDTAARALTENAVLMGVEPHEMDLTSPLAYLPMGSDLRRTLEDQTVSQVHEVSGNESDYEQAKERIEAALTIGRDVEGLPIVFDDISGIAAWLASEGIR